MYCAAPILNLNTARQQKVQTVWLLNITYDGVIHLSVCSNEEVAREMLALHAIEGWSTHSDPRDPRKLHREEIIKSYFLDREDENYTLMETELITEAAYYE